MRRNYPILCLMLLISCISGCFLFRGGQMEIPANAQSAYHEAVTLYENKKYAEAETQFLNLSSSNRQSILIKYYLGLSLYQQDKLSEARRQFRQLTGLSKSSPHGYYGLGLVDLKRKHRKFDALDWFRKALKQDPTFVDAQWQLAITRLSITSGLFGAFSIGEVRQEFLRVIELDPDHHEAYYTLGKTYYTYGELDNAETAIPYFEQQLAVNPDHHEARYQMGLAYIDMERIEEGIATLEAIRRRSSDWETKIQQAIAEAKLRNALVRADSIFFVLNKLPGRERRLYFDLTPILPPGQSTTSDNMSMREIEEVAFRYWKAHDPTPSTPENERYVEHCRRIAYARRYFGRGSWPWDKRGEIYIRYGEPSSRQVYTADTALESPDVNAQFGIRQVERWTYDAPPLTFEFVDQGSNFAFDLPLPPATGDIANLAEETINDPGTRSEMAALETPSVYKSDYEHGPPLRFSYSLAIFRGTNGQPELEVDYAIPATELTFNGQAAALETALMLFDQNWQEITRTIEQNSLSSQTDSGSRTTQVAIYRRTLAIPSGQHQFTIQLTDPQSQRIGVYRQPVEVLPFQPNTLAMSDIRLVTRVQQASNGAFIRHGRRLIPNPTSIYTRTRPLTLYFEIYNLQKDVNDRTNLTIEYTVFPLSGTSRPTLAVADQTLSQDAEGQEFVLIQEEEGTQEMLYRDIAIDMGAAEPGRYALQITVMDRNRNKSVNKTTVFQMVR